jgi:ATP-dependent exoDNAse (exonuclease V) beta subunit/ribosomal protein L37AE/L43A
MSPTPRIARVPHTSKQPDACPHCGSHAFTRRGTRKKKLEIVQLWRCSSCKRAFTPGPAALQNKTYPLRMVLSALSDYDTGHSLKDTATRLKKKTGRHVSPSTIMLWLQEYKQHCSYRRLRREGLRRFPAVQAIHSIKLYHRQIYAYAYHRPKLELVRMGTLDDKRAGDTHFAALAEFLESIPSICPHDLFTRDDDPKARASQAAPRWADASRIIVNSKQNAATDTAALIIPAVGNNKLRHETLQHFMLANDSVTVAIEIPIWLDEDDITALEAEHHIELAPRIDGKSRAITGHIDFLQVRNGAVHVLDYKPDARTNRPIAQLAIYALALTRRVPGLKLFDIKCAWFNEHEYCEMFPRTLFARRPVGMHHKIP